jgi:hypothetical protein
VKNIKEHLQAKGEKLSYKAPTPLSSGYRPEIDITPELNNKDATCYYSLIGVLWWIVKLGQADINVEVSMMSSHLALLRVGHLKELFHIFAYLKAHHNTETVFNLTPVDFDQSLFLRQDWSFSPYDLSNGAVLELIKNAVHGTAIAASIMPFCHEQNGHRAFMAIRAQHAGKDVWDKLHKEAESTLQTLKWSGTVNVTLAQHFGKHC